MTDRPIRTYHARHGRMGVDARRVLDEVAPRFDPVHRDRQRPLVVEVGCGFGDAARAHAVAFPDSDVLALDVHRPGIVHLLRSLEREPLPNLWVLREDALTVLGRDDLGHIEAIHVFFPDPWPKTRHHKRRLIRTDVVDLFAGRMTDGALLRVASDSDGYIATARATLDADGRFEGGPCARPGWRPIAGYEARALDAGRGVNDLAYRHRYGGS